MRAPVPVRKTSSAPSRSERPSVRSAASRPSSRASSSTVSARDARRARRRSAAASRGAPSRTANTFATLASATVPWRVQQQRLVAAALPRLELGERVVQVVEALHARIEHVGAGAPPARGDEGEALGELLRRIDAGPGRDADDARLAGRWSGRRRARPRRARRRGARRRRARRGRAPSRARCGARRRCRPGARGRSTRAPVARRRGGPRGGRRGRRRRGCPRRRRRRRGSRDRARRRAPRPRPRSRRRSRSSSHALLRSARRANALPASRAATRSAARTLRARESGGVELGAAAPLGDGDRDGAGHARRATSTGAATTASPGIHSSRFSAKPRRARELDLARQRLRRRARGGREGVEALARATTPPGAKASWSLPTAVACTGTVLPTCGAARRKPRPSAFSSTAMRPPRAAVRKTVSPSSWASASSTGRAAATRGSPRRTPRPRATRAKPGAVAAVAVALDEAAAQQRGQQAMDRRLGAARGPAPRDDTPRGSPGRVEVEEHVDGLLDGGGRCFTESEQTF